MPSVSWFVFCSTDAYNNIADDILWFGRYHIFAVAPALNF
jgi:hypothetical protein